MGGYIYNRLFCIWKSISAGYLPFGLDHGISLSGMRTYKSRNPAFASGLQRSMEDASVYLCIAAGVVIFAWKRYICKKPIGKWFKTGCVVCVVLMVIYYVWRMYRYFPDQPPMSYYHYNLLRLLMDVAFGALK